MPSESAPTRSGGATNPYSEFTCRCKYFSLERWWRSQWINSISDELDDCSCARVTINGFHDALHTRLWRHQQNANRASETHILYMWISSFDRNSFCRARNKIMYGKSWRTIWPWASGTTKPRRRDLYLPESPRSIHIYGTDSLFVTNPVPEPTRIVDWSIWNISETILSQTFICNK